MTKICLFKFIQQQTLTLFKQMFNFLFLYFILISERYGLLDTHQRLQLISAKFYFVYLFSYGLF